MAVFKCKMCGGELQIGAGATVAECEYCGTQQTLPRLSDDRKANLYDRANHFRRNNDFDKAMGIYEQLLNEDGTDAEAYWSLVLCRYGIEYVADPKTRKQIPTVNRAQFTSVFDDDNYKSALQYADLAQRQLYEAEARAINEIQKGILTISQKEEPFDVFICYKETDSNGRRTPDSVLATDLYHQLVREGFKVFFSRITLEDKLGAAYEPYIFAALNSAKVMVVLGTRPEYFQAVWVKNEWSRYLALIRQGQQKILIPAYRDMDPYDLPEEFSHLQAQDMSKLGFMQDLLYGIKKLVRAAVPQSGVVKETVIAGGVNAEALLKRAFMFLEDGDWNAADEYCEKVLDADPECAKAYLGKLMAEQKVKKQDYLESVSAALEENSYYQKAVRFADDELAKTLTVIARKNRESVETARKDAILAKAKAAAARENFVDCQEAIALLETIRGWKDADATLASCRRNLDQLEAKKQEKTKREKKLMFILLGCFAVVIILILTLTMCSNSGSRYQKAVKLMENGDYDKAMIAFRELGDYEDSVQMIKQCRYMQAVALMESGDYRGAYSEFDALGDYEDSAAQAVGCSYEIARALMAESKYDEAQTVFESIRDHKDSSEMIYECRYQKALALLTEGKMADAHDIFESMRGYKDSTTKIQECYYRTLLILMEDGAYELALHQLEFLEDSYKDCADLRKECLYQQALAMIADGKNEEALTLLTEIGDYKDSADQVKALNAQFGKAELFKNGIWWSVDNSGCYLVTEVINDNSIRITIRWPVDGWDDVVYEMTGLWDADAGKLKYSKGLSYSAPPAGEYVNWYSNGNGYFYYQDSRLYWDSHENAEDQQFQYSGNGSVRNCALCGAPYWAEELKNGLCKGCNAMYEHDQQDDLCVVCGKNPSEGYGMSAMECYECYQKTHNDDIVGTYYANYENVRITIEYNDTTDYVMTYEDLSAGIKISRIGLSYYSQQDTYNTGLFFDLSESGGKYKGYVEFCMSIGARAEYNYNALIEGVEDTGGYYSPLSKQ